MTYAVIATGGKQYLVEPGQKLKIEKLPGETGEIVHFEPLLVADGDSIKLGTPQVKGAKVTGKIEQQGRAKKVLVVKYKPKVRYRKKMGHRQSFTEISITSIV